MVKRFAVLAALVAVLVFSGSASAGKKGRGISPGTGSNPSSTVVSGYTKKTGTDVPTHRRSIADSKFSNNFSTKGNTNPFTGQPGTRVTPPKK